MFKKRKNTKIEVINKNGVQTTESFDSNQSPYNNHSDELPSFQSPIHRQTDVNNPSTRWLHTKANPNGYKLTYGIVNKLLNTPPKYFIYAKPNSKDLTKPEEIISMDYVHNKWTLNNMYDIFKEAFSQALGVNMACIVRVVNSNNEYDYLVFNTSHIKDGEYYRDAKTRKITKIVFKWLASGGGKIEGSISDIEPQTITAEIGINAVMIQPIPDVDDAFGRSSLLNVWNTIVYRSLNRYYSMVYNKKGGIASRLLSAPDSVDSNSRKRFEKEAKKGIESELIEIYYPTMLTTLENADPSKMIQWKENPAPKVNFAELDEMLAKDSSLPPQFTEGVVSGALGGNAPVEENKTINKVLMSYVSMMDKAIKDINTIFFDIKNKNYLAIPYMEMTESINNSTDNQNSVVDTKVENKTDQPQQKVEAAADTKKMARHSKDSKEKTGTKHSEVQFIRKSTKGNSINGMNEDVYYIGNLWQSGEYQYEDWFDGEPFYETLEGEEIKKFVDNPFKKKQHYLSVEHPWDVSYENAIGIIEVKGYTEENGIVKDVTEIRFKPEFDPKMDEIKLSPVYMHGFRFEDDKVFQTDLDLLNAGMTFYPRSELTNMETTAKRIE